MKGNTKQQSNRCKMGIPVGITIALIGLTGIINSSVNYETVGIYGLIPYIALFLIGPPFARMSIMVNGAHSRIDEINETLK